MLILVISQNLHFILSLTVDNLTWSRFLNSRMSLQASCSLCLCSSVLGWVTWRHSKAWWDTGRQTPQKYMQEEEVSVAGAFRETTHPGFSLLFILIRVVRLCTNCPETNEFSKSEAELESKTNQHNLSRQRSSVQLKSYQHLNHNIYFQILFYLIND